MAQNLRVGNADASRDQEEYYTFACLVAFYEGANYLR